MKGKFVALITAVCVALLIGLSVSISAQETITVLMGVDAAGGKMTEKAEEFEKLTGIKVNLVIVSWEDLTTRQAVALGSRAPTYDVLDTWRAWVAQYAPNEYYEPLTNYISKKRFGELVPSLIDVFSYKDILYAHPLLASWTIMFYNKRMFKEAGLDPERAPRIWDEFVVVGKKLTKDTDGDGVIDQYGYIDSYQAGEAGVTTFLRFLGSAGGKFWEIREGKVYFTFNSSQGAEALKFMRDLIEKHKMMDPGVLTYDQQDCAKLFSEGRAAMFNNWEMMTFIFNDPAQSKIAGNVGYALPPGRTAEWTSSIAGHEGLAISSFSQHKKAAWKWIEFVTSGENIKARAIEQGFSPVYTDLFSDYKVLENMPQLEVVLEASKHQIIRPPLPEYQQISDIMSEQIQLALLGAKKAKEALDVAAERANKLLGW